jgi:hypothetical protein
MKTSAMQTIKNQWAQIESLKLFEIEVTNKETKEQGWIIFDIEIQGSSFVAQHEALNTEQEKSTKIAFCKVKIDPDFSLDMNLQELYSECVEAIIESEFYQLAD